MMTRVEAWLQHLAWLLVGGTGVVYAAMLYLLESSDPYAVVNHPWQPTVLHLHVLSAPLAVFAVGLIWRRHVLERWRSRRIGRRASGLGLAVVFPLMVVSGYVIQTAVEPDFRRPAGWAHLAASALWLGAYLLHQLRPRSLPAPATAPRARVIAPPSAGSSRQPEAST